MENFTDLLSDLEVLYPQFSFKNGKKFAFRPPKTIFFGPYEPHAELLLLHELGHATLGETTFKTDVERLKIESRAWNQAKLLAKSLNVPFDQAFAEEKLDSYRDWLHQKSICKKCHLTRFQTEDGKYHCPKCDS